MLDGFSGEELGPACVAGAEFDVFDLDAFFEALRLVASVGGRTGGGPAELRPSPPESAAAYAAIVPDTPSRVLDARGLSATLIRGLR